MPDLYMHFNNMGFDTSMYASSWFLTLFTTTLPLDLANRIMDLFLVDVIYLIFLAYFFCSLNITLNILFLKIDRDI